VWSLARPKCSINAEDSAFFETEQESLRSSGNGAAATVYLLATYKGQFTAGMNFRSFPSDNQELPIRLQLRHGPNHIVRSQVRIKPLCALAPALAVRTDNRKETLSGWDVVSASARERVHNDKNFDALSGGGGAFDRYVRYRQSGPAA
jgi:hypothetical protein